MERGRHDLVKRAPAPGGVVFSGEAENQFVPGALDFLENAGQVICLLVNSPPQSLELFDGTDRNADAVLGVAGVGVFAKGYVGFDLVFDVAALVHLEVDFLDLVVLLAVGDIKKGEPPISS